jgi:hypothetical protein
MEAFEGQYSGAELTRTVMEAMRWSKTVIPSR